MIPPTIIFVVMQAVMFAVATLGVFLVVRGRLERSALRRRSLSLAASDVEAVEVDWLAPNGSSKLDRSFGRLIHMTGLEISPGGAMGLIGLSGGAATLGFAALGLPEWVWPVGFLLGLALPFSGLLMLRGQWRGKVQEQIPDAYLMLARSLRAGMSLSQALVTCGEYSQPPLATELRRVSARIELGLPVVAALEGLAERVRLLDVLASAVALQQGVRGEPRAAS